MEKRNCVRDDNRWLKDQIFIGATNGYHHHLNDLTDKDCINGDLVHGFSWPPRSYTCTFCKREFRSAQALGGHMNVHRRDRARLKQMSSTTYTSLFNLQPNPNFSPHFSSKMSPSSVQHDLSYSTAHLSYRLRDNVGENLTMMKSHSPGLGFCMFHGFPCEDELKMAKNSEIVRWDSEIGESKSDDLDLELRLGCS